MTFLTKLLFGGLQAVAGLRAEGKENGVVPRSLQADMDEERQLAAMVCSLENKDECLMCGA